MGSLALLPLGYLIAGPLASVLGARTVLGVGCLIGLVLLAVGVAPRSVRELDGGSITEQLPREVAIEAGSEA